MSTAVSRAPARRDLVASVVSEALLGLAAPVQQVWGVPQDSADPARQAWEVLQDSADPVRQAWEVLQDSAALAQVLQDSAALAQGLQDSADPVRQA